MSTIIERPGSRYEGGQMTRRDLFRSLSALSAMALAPPRVMGQSRDSVLPVPVRTLNHVSLSSSNVQYSVLWYQRVFGMSMVYHQDVPGTAGVYILKIGAGPSYIALSRKGPESVATSEPSRPHFAWGVKNFDVDRCMRALTEHHVWPARVAIREGTVELNFEDPDGFPLQFTDESSCGGGGYLGDLCDPSTTPLRVPGDPPPIAARTLNHVTYMVPDLQRSLAWYQKLTDMKIATYQELKGGPRTAGYQGPPIPILRIGAGPQHLALTEGSGPLVSRPRFGLGVEGFDLDQVRKRLAEHGVPAFAASSVKWASPTSWTPMRVRTREGVTQELLVEDPDGAEIQLQDVTYCGGGGALGNVCDPRQRPFPGSR